MQCQIRKWDLEDAPDLARALNDRGVQDNLRDGLPYPYTTGDAEDYISSVLASQQNEVFAFAVALEGKAIGSIGVFRRQNIHRLTAEIGYYLAREHWGAGIMSRAVRLACRRVFADSDIVRIYAEPFADNEASCRVLEKAGFTYEGAMRANAVKNGAIKDMKLYSLLRSEI